MTDRMKYFPITCLKYGFIVQFLPFNIETLFLTCNFKIVYNEIFYGLFFFKEYFIPEARKSRAVFSSSNFFFSFWDQAPNFLIYHQANVFSMPKHKNIYDDSAGSG